MLIKLILLFYLLIFNIDLSSSKQRLKKFSCPVIRKCPNHKHKICGSDGKLYNSHCHLKKASCETGILLRAVHADECESIDSNESFESKIKAKCEPKEYDQMKEQILDSVNDVSILFSQLDEDHDGLISINELLSQLSFFGPSDNSACLLTDLLIHEDKNHDDFLDLDEFQNAFNTLYSVTMVTLDQSHSVNHIQAHIGDNVEIRCDIVSKPRQPVIKWSRYGVDLSSLQIPNVKVFNDGSIYLANVQLSLSGNYTCHAEYNLVVKQVHLLHVIVPPTVEVSPTLQWSNIGQKVTIDCIYENIEQEMKLSWLKNDEPLFFDPRISITRNETRLQIDDVTRSDTGAYTCRLSNLMETIFDQSTSSVIVQKEPFDFPTNFEYKKRLMVFHEKGLSIYSKDCGVLLFEMKAQDVLPQSGLTLCGTKQSTSTSCSWSENAILTDSKFYIGQPLNDRVVVFDSQKFDVIQVISTDPGPTNLWFIQEETEDQLWILCHRHDDYESKKAYNSNEIKIDWSFSSRDQQRHNKKTVQVIRFSKTSQSHNTIHLQPINGQFDLIYNFFAPKFSSLLAVNVRDNNRFAYVTQWDERALIKVDMKRFKYIKTINLADCQPINGVFTIHGFLIVQCQTPITHQLNGQLLLDQTTDSIISYNPHIKAFKTYLSPNHNFLINVYHNASSLNPVSTTIIVQRVTPNGLTFLYDVRTTLNIVNCDFIWKNGNYDALLASGTLNREDLLYLSLNDGRVELISGIGKPKEGSKRLMAVSQPPPHICAISSFDSIFLVNLDSNKIDCEIAHLSNTSLLLWFH